MPTSETETAATAEAAPAAPAPAPQATDKVAVVTFGTPIVRSNGMTIAQVTLRKPKGGDLRGFNLQALINSDVNAIIAVTPRIANPFITEQEVADLEADDFAEIGGALSGFFMTQTHKDLIKQMYGG